MSVTALLVPAVLLATFALPEVGRRPFFLTAATVGVIFTLLLTRRLHATLFAIPLGLVVGYVLFYFAFFAFFYDPQ